MRVNEHREHAQGAIVLDEAHPAHIGGQIIDNASVLERDFAGFAPLQVQDQILDPGGDLIPVGEGFNVNGTKVGMALPFKVGDQMTANKAATATNYDFVRFHNKSRKVTHDERKSTENRQKTLRLSGFALRVNFNS
jgi:hypothetical protein